MKTLILKAIQNIFQSYTVIKKIKTILTNNIKSTYTHIPIQNKPRKAKNIMN